MAKLRYEKRTEHKKEVVCPDCGHITKVEWQDIERTWVEVERVYLTRWDCPIQPVERQAA